MSTNNFGLPPPKTDIGPPPPRPKGKLRPEALEVIIKAKETELGRVPCYHCENMMRWDACWLCLCHDMAICPNCHNIQSKNQ